mgnify:FL=1
MGHNIHVPNLPNADDFSRDILASHASKGKLYRNALLITGGIFSLGILAFLVRFFTVEFNSDNREPWAYYAAMVAFLLTTAGAAPIVAVALRLVKAHWRRPMTRVAEIYGSVGLLTLLLFIPLLFLIPSASGRRTLWFQDHDSPLGIGTYGKIPRAPHAYELLSLLFLVICGLALLSLSALPDIAKLRDQNS